MPQETSRLYGACACERNQYLIELPVASVSSATIFFDNSARSRRPQASPVTAWLRIPLDCYHSATIARFPDESHATIRRTFLLSPARPSAPAVRRQFCGYCGTHLTACDEATENPRAAAATGDDGQDVIDVTLGSLLDASLDELRRLKLTSDDEDASGDSDNEDVGGGLVRGGSVTEETHVPLPSAPRQPTTVLGGSVTDETHISNAAPRARLAQASSVNQETHILETARQERAVEGGAARDTVPALLPHHPMQHRMQHRGIPYFEHMIENSSLGRLRRQRAGHASSDGNTVVQWEIVEYDGDDLAGATSLTDGGSPAKRVKMDV